MIKNSVFWSKIRFSHIYQDRPVLNRAIASLAKKFNWGNIGLARPDFLSNEGTAYQKFTKHSAPTDVEAAYDCDVFLRGLQFATDSYANDDYDENSGDDWRLPSFKVENLVVNKFLNDTSDDSEFVDVLGRLKERARVFMWCVDPSIICCG